MGLEWRQRRLLAFGAWPQGAVPQGGQRWSVADISDHCSSLVPVCTWWYSSSPAWQRIDHSAYAKISHLADAAVAYLRQTGGTNSHLELQIGQKQFSHPRHRQKMNTCARSGIALITGGKKMGRTSLRASLLTLLCAAWLVSCASTSGYQEPEQTDDGWQTASLGDVGIDEKEISKAVARIQHNTYQNVHSMLIVKDGKLVFEAYFGGYAWDYDGDQFRGRRTDFDMNTTHNLASVTKSLTSALVGIAIDQGLIQGVDEPAFSFFPAYADLEGEQKGKITLEHLLTMTSGLRWNEQELPYSDTTNDLVQLFLVRNPVEYILAKPVVSEPGTKWYYNGGGTNLLGEVIREATGQRMDAYAEQVLFAPLGITNYEWDHINPDMIHASGNLKLRPRDMAKFGYLFLNGGVWNGERIISREWVEESTSRHALPRWADGYGYQWWLRTYHSGSEPVDSFYAAGWGGQRITVFPSLDMVVVFTGGNYVQEEPVDEIITRYILPAVQ
jgi:CubicO group peptidase (beta-lactamase class C family)